MLVRAFRLTDKLTMALLRVSGWLAELLLVRLYVLRVALVESVQTVYALMRIGRAAVASPVERRRALMARRAEASARPAVREDPLRSQNRALSLFTVVLMVSLIGLVLWFTGSVHSTATLPTIQAGTLSLASPTPNSFPTLTQTATSIGQPLKDKGTIVYSLRQNGHENLWALIPGESQPARLTNTPSDDRDPVFSPDGTQVAFSSRRDGLWQIYILDVATLNVRRLTFTTDYAAAPTWSPDGKFIAYEGYVEGNLDIYIIPTDGTGDVKRLTGDPAPDFSPVWSPVDGRKIAYVSLRDGYPQIYIYDLNSTALHDAVALKLTNTADVEEGHPAWSPDGKTIAYSGRSNGYDLVFTQSIDTPQATPVQIARGREPTWSPSGTSLVVALDSGETTSFVGASVGAVDIMALAYQFPGRANHPNWGKNILQGSGLPGITETPIVQAVRRASPRPNPPYGSLAELSGVAAPPPGGFLLDGVSDSFMALRSAVNAKAGSDFLGKLTGATWDLSRRPDIGQPRDSWHYTGRAIDFDPNLVYGDPAPVEAVREDIGGDTYWRIYIRVPDAYQGGQLGEPLKAIPWDFASRTGGDPQVYEAGGRLKTAIPAGYYIDFTQLAEDYGWTRVPSTSAWRRNFPSLMFWEYDKRDNLTWENAMLELYTADQVGQFLNGPTLMPTQLPGPSDTPGVRTPTPIPPDQKGP